MSSYFGRFQRLGDTPTAPKVCQALGCEELLRWGQHGKFCTKHSTQRSFGKRIKRKETREK